MAERARIRRIQVTNLFGIFNHEIRLNLDERITILHGPNGFGKTIILQMLDGLFRKQWERLRGIPFDVFLVELEDGGIVQAKQITRSLFPGRSFSLKSRSLEVSFATEPGVEPQEFFYRGEINPAFVRLARRTKLRARTPEPVPSGDAPDWMKGLCEQIRICLIHTQRLGVIGARQPTTEIYSEEIVKAIESLLGVYASRSQELDSSFLNRLFQQGKSASLSVDDIQEKLERIEAKRAQLISLGFLAHERDAQPPPKIDESKLDVLSVYVHDMEAKLAVFEEMAQKVQLLTDAINKRFTYKRMSISKETGFVFKSVINDAILPLGSLSSGEQHELVLFYELLFKVEPNALVLLDEPEISLHLAWQQQVLGDLVEMVKLSSFDVLVATHSPGIIGKRWDLTVELKGPDLSDAAQ